MRNRLSKICLGLFLSIAICWSIAIARPSPAQTDFNLKSDIISLQSRISRLEQEVNRLRSNSRSPNRTNNNRVKQPDAPSCQNCNSGNPPVVNGQAIGRSDPLYEKLATLLIELKEDVKDLDRRLSNVENTASP